MLYNSPLSQTKSEIYNMRLLHTALTRVLIVLLLPLICLLPRASAQEVQLPKHLNPAMEHLLAGVGLTTAATLNQDLAGSLIDYVAAPKQMQSSYSMGPRQGAVSSYYEFKLERPFAVVMNLIYHPDIPAYITAPASVRLSRWIEINGSRQPLPRITAELDGLAAPLIVNGVEFVENTPDINTGAYYAYEQERTLILMKYQGRRVLLSISRQRDRSTVGKKGLVLGADDDWNYLYTGEKGLTRKGLGWVDSYMYQAQAITIYYETYDPVPHVKCGIFKWLHAGWAGINMAKPDHLRNGMQRFAKAFKTVVEELPHDAPDQMAKVFAHIDSLPTKTLRQKARDQHALLSSVYRHDKSLGTKWFRRLFKDDRYCQGLGREELKALLGKAYLKFMLGKAQGVDVSALNPHKWLMAHDW